jgi:hypothetical protein
VVLAHGFTKFVGGNRISPVRKDDFVRGTILLDGPWVVN